MSGLKLNISNAVSELKRPFPIKVQVVDFQGEPVITSRLLEMGLRPGLQVSIEGRATFAGAYILRFGTTAIALRGDEALCTIIQAL